MKSKTRCLDCNAPIDGDETRCKRCERADERARDTRQLRGLGPAYETARAQVLAALALCYWCKASAVTHVSHIPNLVRYTSPAHWVGRVVGACTRCYSTRNYR